MDKNGSLWTWGHPENGQLGHNSEGKFLEKANKISFHFVYEPTKVMQFIERDPKVKGVTVITGVTIRDVTCGVSHGVRINYGLNLMHVLLYLDKSRLPVLLEELLDV